MELVLMADDLIGAIPIARLLRGRFLRDRETSCFCLGKHRVRHPKTDITFNWRAK